MQSDALELQYHNYKQLYSEKVPYIFPKISYYLSRRGGSYFFQKSVTILQGKGVGHLFFQKSVTILQGKGVGHSLFQKPVTILQGVGGSLEKFSKSHLLYLGC